jgi:DNA-binding response OmpR family regulator
MAAAGLLPLRVPPTGCGASEIPMQRKLRLLIVEDEPAIRAGLIDVFVYHGFDVESADDGHDALARASRGRFDMVLLDVMLPGVDGFTLCAELRRRDPELPIVMLTARSTDDDVIHGLALGADDYVAKPFSVAQLVLRVQAVLRRARPPLAQDAVLQLADGIVIDTRNLCATVGADEVRFTRREMEVLQYLAAHSERPVPREELLHRVWGYSREMDIETRTVDIHIAKLRRKLEPDQKQPRHLITVRGGGYRLMTVA